MYYIATVVHRTALRKGLILVLCMLCVFQARVILQDDSGLTYVLHIFDLKGWLILNSTSSCVIPSVVVDSCR
jgi:hypothetical protein